MSFNYLKIKKDKYQEKFCTLFIIPTDSVWCGLRSLVYVLISSFIKYKIYFSFEGSSDWHDKYE